MPDQKKISGYLNKILSSDEFSGSSQIYQKLLKYLVDATLAGKNIKEYTIASELFHKTRDSELQGDSSVRVYVHNIRKKLDSYYRHEGKNDTIQLSIPKGHYVVAFTEVSQKTPLPLVTLYTSLFAVTLLMLLFFIGDRRIGWMKNEPPLPCYDLVWKDFLYSEKPTLIVVGDHYFYLGPTATGQKNVCRDVSINSDEEMDEFLRTFPLKKTDIQKTPLTYLSKQAVWTLYALHPLLSQYHSLPELKLSSDLKLEDFKKYNIIYIGAFRCLGLLRNFISDLGFVYKYAAEEGELTYQFSDSTGTQTFYGSDMDLGKDNYGLDYALTLKLPGPNANTILLFLSTHDIGNMSSVKLFTHKEAHPELIEHMEQSDNSDYFKALFEVKGIKRTEFSIELLDLQPIRNELFE